MEQYIKKSALVAEIENLENTYKKCPTRNSYEEGLKDGRLIGYKDALYKINTLEVKEVDLDEEIKRFTLSKELYEADSVIKAVAKHFFELGLKTQHSSINIPNTDDIFEENGIDPNSKDAKIFKECYYMALEKLKAQKGE